MSRILWLLLKAAPVGALVVVCSVGFALVGYFTHFQDAVVRWLSAVIFGLYWPLCVAEVMCGACDTTSRSHLVLSGAICAVIITGGCLADYCFPHFAESVVYDYIPDYRGLKATMGISVILGFVLASGEAESVRSRRDSELRDNREC